MSVASATYTPNPMGEFKMFTLQHSLQHLENVPNSPKHTKKQQPEQPSVAPMKREWRGTCRYKSGRCSNERTLKFNGEIHTMCEEHRIRHNNNQRRSDLKRRIKKSPEYTSYTYHGATMPVNRPLLKSPLNNSQTRPIPQPTPLISRTECQPKEEILNDINMSNDDDTYDIRPATEAMELTPQEVKILHCILGMDTDSSIDI